MTDERAVRERGILDALGLDDVLVNPASGRERLFDALSPDRPAGLDGRAVHAAWRDGMLRQGREVAPERMAWDTLTQQDRDLDDWIAARLAEKGSTDGD